MEVSDFVFFKDQRDQVLKCAKMYVETTKRYPRNEDIIVLDNDTLRIEFQKEVKVPRALERLFIEVLSNATDHYIRTSKFAVKNGIKRIKGTIYELKPIEVEITDDMIRVTNYGIPIPVEELDGILLPEVIFGNLNSSSNYEDESRSGAGMNGVGAKLFNIFSTYFEIMVLDPIRKLSYQQHWTDNMRVKSTATISKYKGKESSVTVIGKLDFAKFDYPSDYKFDADIRGLFLRICLDMSFATRYPINAVGYGPGSFFEIKKIEDYLRYYYDGNNYISHSVTYDNGSSIEVVYFDSEEQVVISFVNGIRTAQHGVHVESCLNAVLSLVSDLNKKYKKEGVKITKKQIRDNISMIVNYRGIKPELTGQHKSKLEGELLPIDLPESKVKKMMSWNLVLKLTSIFDDKINKRLAKTDGRSRGKVVVPKLKDAALVGKRLKDSDIQPTLITTEGDSAAILAANFRKHFPRGKDLFGILPFRGKPVNPNGKSNLAISKNEEIESIKKAIGLREGVDYSDDKNFAKLRYFNVMIFTDQDYDGSHIACLTINIFYTLFPSLLLRNDFISRMITPKVRVSDGKENIGFYCDADFDEWKSQQTNLGKFTINYYKGLASSTIADIKRDAKDPYILKVIFDDDAENKLLLGFDKKFTDQRKEWLMQDKPEDSFKERKEEQFISILIDTELREYSVHNLSRAIPKLIDGLKVSQRQILWTSLNKWTRKQILTEKVHEVEKLIRKVDQFSGVIDEFVNYHHGQISLSEAIIKMSQTFAGTNNLPYFYQGGIFGSRTEKGKDAGKPRYIKVKPLWWIHYVYKEEDNAILEMEESEGKVSCPKYLLPILPMVLINGNEGVATGFSSTIPSYQLEVVLEWLISRLQGIEISLDLVPYFRGFTGSVTKDDKKFYTFGRIEISDDTLIIKEIPISKSITQYCEFLDKLYFGKQITDYVNYSGPNEPLFYVTGFAEGIETDNMLDFIYNKFELADSDDLTNLVTLDLNQVPTKHSTANDILEEFYNVRLPFFEKRRKSLIEIIKDKIKVLSSRIRFIQLVLEDKITWRNQKKSSIIDQLTKLEFEDVTFVNDFKFYGFTKEEIDKLKSKVEKQEKLLDKYEKITPEEMWLEDLDQFIEGYVSDDKLSELCGGEENGEEKEEKPKKKAQKKKK